MSEEILNKYIELIDKGYCEDCNELNCLGNFPHKEIAKNIKLILEENKKYKEIINKAISKLGKYADEMINNSNAYAICVDLLNILKEVEINVKDFKKIN